MVRTCLVLLLLAAGCEEAACPHGSMLESAGGLALTEAEHPTGWAQEDCSSCHAMSALHRQGCTPDVDLVEISALVEEQGLDGCADCHGDNGVEP